MWARARAACGEADDFISTASTWQASYAMHVALGSSLRVDTMRTALPPRIAQVSPANASSRWVRLTTVRGMALATTKAEGATFSSVRPCPPVLPTGAYNSPPVGRHAPTRGLLRCSQPVLSTWSGKMAHPIGLGVNTLGGLRCLTDQVRTQPELKRNTTRHNRAN